MNILNKCWEIARQKKATGEEVLSEHSITTVSSVLNAGFCPSGTFGWMRIYSAISFYVNSIIQALLKLC